MTFSLSESQTGSAAGKAAPVAGRWLIWIDGVGGFLLLPGDDWTIGGPSGSGDAEICVQGDLARREACIRRQEGDYILQPLATVLLGGRRMNRPAMLRDGDQIALGSGATKGPLRGVGGSPSVSGGRGVRMEFAKPHPLSASARLSLRTRHRTRPHSDGVILVADTCVLGPTRSSHVLAPQATGEVVLLFRNGHWFCRGGRQVVVDGEPFDGRTEILPGARVEACGLTFTLEAAPE